MPRFDALLIDMDRTLFDFDGAEATALAAACEECALRYSDGALVRYREINREVWRRYDRREISHAELNVERFARFLKAVGGEGDSAVLGDRYLRNLGSAGTLLPGALELMRDVCARMPVVIITNGDGATQRGRLGASPMASLVRGMIVSEEAGAAKPDPLMIREGMRLVGITDVSRVIMVGDSLADDIGAAKAAGVVSCWLNPGRKPAPDGLKPDYEIRSLPELRGVLGLDISNG
ncbi:MAG: YjjG family noncanonical pyrimidine nucleotidase [Oscillospiraceae bacterium]|jgi:YjjG family noncanonical pyrimidine nucleotidase|nr:YjjG family noncanonical pyrimidine nucleotidase [Oscillospiraceae bacterium]